MKSNTKFSISVLAAICSVSLFWATALAAIQQPDHHINVSAIACRQADGSFWANWVSKTWDYNGSGGLNSDVLIEKSVDSGPWQIVARGAFTDTTTPKRELSGSFQTAIGIRSLTIRSAAMAKWGNGDAGGQSNSWAVALLNCQPTPTSTPKGKQTEPATITPTATATKTTTTTATATETGTATGTSTATSTATVTATATKTPMPTPTQIVWDESDLSVSSFCTDGLPTFIIKNTGKDMQATTKWSLSVDGTEVMSGDVLLGTGESSRMGFATYKGALVLTVTQRPGYPSVSTASAQIDTEGCATEPTAIRDTSEPAALIYIGTSYNSENEPYANYKIACGAYSGDVRVELKFADGAVYMPGDMKCESTVIVPQYTKLIVLYDGDGKKLSEKVPPIDISTPPSFLERAIYLPIVVK
jgi:hypothetical protein